MTAYNVVTHTSTITDSKSALPARDSSHNILQGLDFLHTKVGFAFFFLSFVFDILD